MTNHFVGIVVFENGNLDGTELTYSENIYLVVASDLDEAKSKIDALAHGDEIESYQTETGTRYQKLLRIVDVNQSLYEPSEEGTSIYSRRLPSLEAYKKMELLWEE